MAWNRPGGEPPIGYQYHPYTGRTYIKLNSGGVWIGDPDCEADWHPDIGNEVYPQMFGCAAVTDVILSYDQESPFPFNIWYNGPPDEAQDPDGAGDWVVYIENSLYNCMSGIGMYGAGYQRMVNTMRAFSMNHTNPPG